MNTSGYKQHISSQFNAELEDVRQRGQSVRALWLKLELERGPQNVQRLEPSQPTRAVWVPI